LTNTLGKQDSIKPYELHQINHCCLANLIGGEVEYILASAIPNAKVRAHYSAL
jgi:hypothetical protein